MKTIDAVIVTYNSAGFLPRLAESIRSCDSFKAVHVVDNRSVDRSVDLAGSLDWGVPAHVSVMPRNLGFGAAVNYGAFSSGSDSSHILIVNPDVELHPSVLQALVSELGSVPRRAAVGTMLVTSDGSPVSSARRFPTLASIIRRQPVDVRPENRVIETDWICGALMLWKRTAFEEVAGFSADYFLYFEDVDICMKASKAGWSVAIDGRHQAIHDQGHGVPTSSGLRRESRRSRRRYAAKWLGFPGAVAAGVADVIDGAAELARRIRVKK